MSTYASHVVAQKRAQNVIVYFCTVAEQTRSKRPLSMDRPRGGSPLAAASSDAAKARQPTLAEEIDDVEREQRVTKAPEAQVEQHGITQHKPHPQESVGVSVRPKRIPKKGNTPSPLRTDADGNTWTWEDDHESEEEHEQHESGNET